MSAQIGDVLGGLRGRLPVLDHAALRLGTSTRQSAGAASTVTRLADDLRLATDDALAAAAAARGGPDEATRAIIALGAHNALVNVELVAKDLSRPGGVAPATFAARAHAAVRSADAWLEQATTGVPHRSVAPLDVTELRFTVARLRGEELPEFAERVARAAEAAGGPIRR